MEKVLNYSHTLLKNYLSKDDIAVDMTAGRGNDTLFLCDIAKYVYAFDIQNEAINDTLDKVKNYSNVSVIKDSHTNIDLYIKEQIKAVIFNLGYLPSGSKNIKTLPSTTIIALNKVLAMMSINGIIVLVIYREHDNCLESNAIEDYVKKLNQKEYEVLKYEFINQINYPPFLIAIRRIK